MGGEGLKRYYHRQLKREVCEIFAGDYFASNNPLIVFSTLLGSCISVCLQDPISKVSGMNHFMLPSALKEGSILLNDDARYGIQSMELLINSMMKLGARRKHMQAKIFGGGKVLGNSVTAVSESNTLFAINYLKMEEIPILSQDVGGNTGRKLFFFADTFDVYVKKIRHDKSLQDAVLREKQFKDWIQQEKRKEEQNSNLTLFD